MLYHNHSATESQRHRGLLGSVQQAGHCFKVVAGWLTVCSHRAQWPEHFMCKAALAWMVSDVIRSSWQEESSNSRYRSTHSGPQANPSKQMPAQATGRGDKTHQVPLPFRIILTHSCHICLRLSHQTEMATGSDKLWGRTKAEKTFNWSFNWLPRCPLISSNETKVRHKYLYQNKLLCSQR